MKKLIRKLLGGVIAVIGIVFVAIQFKPALRDNPAVVTKLRADPAVIDVLRTSCYDCHSNETVWPWYSTIAPVSWWISDHVVEGREVLNFSEWDEDIVVQAVAAGVVAEAVADGGMPIDSYVWMHPEAALTPAEVKLLENWAAALWTEAME